MGDQRSLVDILNNNKNKILEAGKYTQNNLSKLIADVTEADQNR